MLEFSVLFHLIHFLVQFLHRTKKFIELLHPSRGNHVIAKLVFLVVVSDGSNFIFVILDGFFLQRFGLTKRSTDGGVIYLVHGVDCFNDVAAFLEIWACFVGVRVLVNFVGLFVVFAWVRNWGRGKRGFD